MVPGVGVEPTHPKVEVFETSASAIPPPLLDLSIIMIEWLIVKNLLFSAQKLLILYAVSMISLSLS